VTEQEHVGSGRPDHAYGTFSPTKAGLALGSVTPARLWRRCGALSLAVEHGATRYGFEG
jgi:hypothetical protein